MAGLIRVYLSLKYLYQAHTAVIAVQENIRLTSYVLTQAISTAGYAGCARLTQLQIEDATNRDFTAENSIRGFASDHPPSYLVKKDIAPNTDIIVIQKADADETRVTGDIKAGATTIKVKENPATRDNLYLLLSNCNFADLFMARNFDNGPSTESVTAIRYKYAIDTSVVGRYAELAYFIGDTGNVNEQGLPIYSLFVVTNKGNKEAMFDGVSGMKIKYGIDLQGRGAIDGYFAHDYIDTKKIWDKVVSVIITLTQQEDKSVKKSWDIYIKLRNRG